MLLFPLGYRGVTMNERVFYENGDVRVTNARFIVGGQTYAMAGVTSVRDGRIPPNRGLALVLIVIGVIFVLAGGAGAKLFGILLAGLGGYLAYTAKATHLVILHSSSGETRALSNTDAGFIHGVIDALNQSLIHRG